MIKETKPEWLKGEPWQDLAVNVGGLVVIDGDYWLLEGDGWSCLVVAQRSLAYINPA